MSKPHCFFFCFHMYAFAMNGCVCACLYMGGHMCVGMPTCGFTCRWRPEADAQNHPQLPFFLTHWGKVSLSNTGSPIWPVSLTSLLWGSPVSIMGQSPCLPAICVSSRVPNCDLHVCTANILATEKPLQIYMHN